jgi:hypothetical protein
MTGGRPSIVRVRVRWASRPPRVGTWIESPNARAAFRVLETWESGMTCARYDRASVPFGVVTRAWSDVAARRPDAALSRPRPGDHLRSLLRRGAITEREYAAAERFRDTLERSMPALPVSGAVPMGGGGHGASVTDRHLHARRAIERALAVVERDHVPVLNWVVARNGSVAAYAAHVHRRPTTAADQLRGALRSLVGLYDPPVTGRFR